MLSYSVTLDERISLTGAPTRFQFVGYSREEVLRMEQEIAAIALVDAPQARIEVPRARLTPLSPMHANAFAGNVFHEDGRTVPFATIKRGEDVVFGDDHDARLATTASASLPVAWYGGVLFSGYGHVLLESFARLTPQMIASPWPILFHVNAAAPPDQASFLNMLGHLGVEPDRVRWVDGVVDVERLMVTEPGFVISVRVHLPWAAMLRDAIRGHLPPPDPGAVPVLLSRSAWQGPRRRAFGEVELEAALAGAVRIVHPQTLGFAEQAAAVNASDRLIGLIGSQMHNLILRARETPPEVVCFAYARPQSAFFQVDLLTGGVRTYVSAAFHGRVFPFGGAAPFLLRLDLARTGLMAAGFPSPPELAADPAQIEALEEQFYGAWIERFIDMKLSRPSRYWKDEGEFIDKMDSFATLLAERLEEPMKDPAFAATLRRGAREALELRHARGIPAQLKARFLRDGLGDG